MSASIALVMTTYNSEDYLDRAIDSILAQTHTNWHLTLWDDGSSDRSSDICRRYAALDGRINFIAAPHTGRVTALADAIDAAPPHPYLAFVDSDDLLAPTALADTIEVLEQHPQMGVVYTNYLIIDPDDRVLGLGTRCQIPYSADRLLVDFISFHFRLLRREAFDRVGGIDREFRSAEDYDLCLKLSEVTEFYHLERPLYYYRKHDLSISAVTKAEQTEYSAKAVNNALHRRGLTDRYRFLVAPTGQFHLQQRQPHHRSSTIPKIIHQTWKDENLPPRLAAFQQTWQEKHPDWEYKLWTDAENREFLARFYPWFLPIYDSYEHHICRVDAIRYFWLDYYGGVYVDLDFECLASIDLLLTERSLVLSLEPAAHTSDNDLAQAQNLSEIISPAWMASAPEHPFWQHVWQHLIENRSNSNPLDATGPFLLTRAYQAFDRSAEITMIPADRLHPISLAESQAGKLFDLTVRQHISNHALGIHHWCSSWWENKAIDLDLLNKNTEAIVVEKNLALFVATLNHANYQQVSIELSSQPLVSCLMVTKDRPELAKRSIFCFLQQTYINKELIIIDNGNTPELVEFIRSLSHPQINYYRVSPSGLTLGDFRNLSVAKANGDYLAIWDDDDLSDPARLEIQMTAIKAFNVDFCLLDSVYIWWPHQQHLAKSCRQAWENTIVYRKEIFSPYPRDRRGEDTELLESLMARYRVAALTRPELYLYCYHESNTWNAQHFEPHWYIAQSHLEGDEYIKMMQQLELRLPIHAYLQSLPSIPTNNEVKIVESDAIDSYHQAVERSSDRPQVGLNIANCMDEGFGISEGIKYCLSALDAQQIPYSLHQIKGEQNSDLHSINLLHANPDWILNPQQQILPSLGERYFQNKYNIGYWVWESLEYFPAQWLQCFPLFNEIWTPSDYARAALSRVSPVPVVTIPHSIELPASPQFSRQELGLPVDRFIFLFIYDPLSLAVRKNPEGTIAAFKQAFSPTDDRVSLIIKTKGLDRQSRAHLVALIDDYPQIEIIDEKFSRDRLNSLIYHCDCYISLHRAEGFGLTLAEAMFYGKPTIATGFSGNLDFMNDRNSLLVDYDPVRLDRNFSYFGAGTIWAEPNLDRASEYMCQVIDRPEFAQQLGHRAARDIRSQLSPQAVGTKIQDRLQKYELN